VSRETKEAKAVRLVAEQRVRFTLVSVGRAVATVNGASGDYSVTFDGHRWSCACDHGANSRGLCSHALAAQTIFRAVVGAFQPATAAR